MKTLRAFALIGLVTGVFMVAACSGDDSAAPPPGNEHNDASTLPGNDSGPASDAPAPPDGNASDGGTQDFADFVKDLVLHHTTETESPATVPADDQLVDKMDPGEYPASFFQ